MEKLQEYWGKEILLELKNVEEYLILRPLLNNLGSGWNTDTISSHDFGKGRVGIDLYGDGYVTGNEFDVCEYEVMNASDFLEEAKDFMNRYNTASLEELYSEEVGIKVYNQQQWQKLLPRLNEVSGDNFTESEFEDNFDSDEDDYVIVNLYDDTVRSVLSFEENFGIEDYILLEPDRFIGESLSYQIY